MATMREAVKRYFEDNGFGADGGYSDAWVDFKLGTLPFPLPNSPARVKAVRFHDLNHVLTGYRTDFAGECEISAWELGAGCRSFVAAWALNLGGLAGGVFLQPRTVWNAFVAGRRSRATYALDYEQAMNTEVETLRAELPVVTRASGNLTDALLFALATLGGVVVGLTMMAVLLSPITLILWLRGRKAKLGTAVAASR